MDLVEFLTARLDEDEAAAKAATAGPWRYNPRKAWHLPPPSFGVLSAAEEFVAAGPVERPVCVAATGMADDPQSMRDAAHIARHDPARVLADVAAKRDTVEAYRLRVEQSDSAEDVSLLVGYHATGLGIALRNLAVVHAGHPDYDEAWRP